MWEEAQEKAVDRQGEDPGRKLSPTRYSPLDGRHLHRPVGLLRRNPGVLLLDRLSSSLLLPQVRCGEEGFVSRLSQ